MRLGDLPRAARLYLALVCALAVAQAGLAASWPRVPYAPLELVVLFGLATAWAHSVPVSTPGKRAYHVSLSFVVAAVPLLAPLQLVALIAVVHAIDWLRHQQSRSRVALGFNTSVWASAALLAQLTYLLLWPEARIDLNRFECLVAAVAAVAVFVAHTKALACGALWFANRIPPREQHQFELEALLTEGALALMGLPLAQLATSAPWAAAVSAAPLWLVHRGLDLPDVRVQRRQDGLTELFTAPYLTETATRELNRARRFRRQLVLLLLDVDGLTRINADYGQSAGDAVLRATARSIKRATREYDLAARLAGGLFAVLLPETDLAQAQVVAERIRRDAAGGHPEIPNAIEQVPLTVSIGGAVFTSGSASATELFECAQAALGRAKRDGGNQIEFSTVESAPERGANLHVTDRSVSHIGSERSDAVTRARVGVRSQKRSAWQTVVTSPVTLLLGCAAISLGLVQRSDPADWRLLAMLVSLAALGGLAFTFRNLTMALALAFELHVASAQLLALRYWRLWPLYLALAATGFAVAYTYQRFGILPALAMAAATLSCRQLATGYVDRTLESVRKLRTANEQLEHRAFHDPLTGLANRALFSQRLEHALVRAGTGSIAVLFLDLDNFKPVNDSLGHAAGDALLVAASQRLVQCVRREDSIARLGGDEFTVLLENMRDPSDAARLAERIGEALSEAFLIAGQQVYVSSSIGIALDTDRAHRPDDLLREADMAMYRAKSGGKARYEIFDTGMGSRAMERLELETDLRHAAARGQLRVCYLPLTEMASGAPDAVEASLEWQHPRRGTLAYSQFDAIAEECGAALDLADWTIQHACAEAAARPHRSVHVSISERVLEEPDALASLVRSALETTGLPPARLWLSLPESALSRDLAPLDDLGVRLAVDALGRGESSLDRLSSAPIHALKLAPDANPALTRATHALALALGLSVVAPASSKPSAAAA